MQCANCSIALSEDAIARFQFSTRFWVPKW